MIVNSVLPIRLHEDPDLFREAVNYTAACTGFVARLIEKDYFCSIVLQRLASDLVTVLATALGYPLRIDRT